MADVVPIPSSSGESSPLELNPRYRHAMIVAFCLLAALGVVKMSSSSASFAPPTTVRTVKKSLVPQKYWMNCYPHGDIAEYFGMGDLGIYETPSLVLKCPKKNQRAIACSCGVTDGFVATGNDFSWEGNSCECQWRSYWGRPFMGEFKFKGAVTCATILMKNETMPECLLNDKPQTAM